MSTHSHSSAYTPKAERLSPSSVTPTRHTQSAGATPDFTSPSAYINHDAFIHTEPNTPHGLTDTSYGLPSSSSTMSMGLSNPHAIEGEYGFAYGDFTVTGAYPVAGVEEQQFGQTTAEPEDERTPVVSDTQQPIPLSSLPTHLRLHDPSMRAPRPQKPLMSPLRTFSPQSDLAAYQPIPYDPSQVPHCIDPSAAFHYPQLPTGPLSNPTYIRITHSTCQDTSRSLRRHIWLTIPCNNSLRFIRPWSNKCTSQEHRIMFPLDSSTSLLVHLAAAQVCPPLASRFPKPRWRDRNRRHRSSACNGRR